MKRAIPVKLNQQQLELLDRLVGAGAAKSREAIFVRAINELAGDKRPMLPEGGGPT